MRAIDISQWQGAIDFKKVPSEIVIMKMSGGDDGLYYDSKASINYGAAKAAGKAVGMYHFAGGKDPIAEADYFITACSPLEKNDVMVLDWEVPHPDPVNWCVQFINRVIAKTGVRPLFYTNSARLFEYNWQPVANLNVGLWVAHYGVPANGNVPIKYWPTYVMHQYTSSGAEAGIGGRVDVNEWFGTKEQFQKYGYQPATTPPPAPVVTTSDLTEKFPIAFGKQDVDDNILAKGERQIRQVGVNGERTVVTRITYTNGAETARAIQSDLVTIAPVNELTAVGTYIAPEPEPTPDPVPNPDPTPTPEPTQPGMSLGEVFQSIFDFFRTLWSKIKPKK